MYGQTHEWWSQYHQVFGTEAFSFLRGIFDMAGVGKKFDFHGSFTSKAGAVKKERETPGAFVRERKVNGKVRWFVLTERK